MNWTVSAPAKGGYRQGFEHLSEALRDAARLVGVERRDMIEIDSPDGGTTYCYATQAEAEADREGAYAVQIHDADELARRAS